MKSHLGMGISITVPNPISHRTRQSQNPIMPVQGSAKEFFPGLVNFLTAVAYHLCLNLPRAFQQPKKYSFGDPCMEVIDVKFVAIIKPMHLSSLRPACIKFFHATQCLSITSILLCYSNIQNQGQRHLGCYMLHRYMHGPIFFEQYCCQNDMCNLSQNQTT